MDTNAGAATSNFSFGKRTTVGMDGYWSPSGFTELFKIESNGNVGIGTSTPSEKLDVNGRIQTGNGSGAVAMTTNDGGGNANITFNHTGKVPDQTGNAGRITVNVDSTTGAYMSFKLADNLPAGVSNSTTQVMKVDSAGNLTATAFLYNSDRRLKENIQTLNGLKLVQQLRGVSFDWKKSGESSIGFIAQEVESVLPEVVQTDPETGLKKVGYGNVTAVLVEAVKAQQQQIEALKIELKNLKNQ